MASITGSVNEKVYTINRWLGLNQNPDGDTKLKYGEASAMRNFRVTRDGNLQKRPGTRPVAAPMANSRVEALWHGYLGGVERIFAICDKKLWACLDNLGGWSFSQLGSFSSTNRPHMFGFGDKLWILTGSEYYCWDGTSLAVVSGYIPLVAVSIMPIDGGGGGDLIEQVNKLTGKRRCRLSFDGSHGSFQLPETGLQQIVSVKRTDNDTAVTYTADLAAGTVTITDNTLVTSSLVNAVEVCYEMNTASQRGEVTGMHFSEMYNGVTDSRVFLYGNPNKRSTAIYCELDEIGQPRADYFPDQNEMRVGVSNTPITGLIRHGSRLIAFKPDETWSVHYGEIALEDGGTTVGFYVLPVNRQLGNVAMGQVQLVLNNPVSLCGSDVYEWTPNSNSGLTYDERQAVRISDRVWAALKGFDLAGCLCYDDNDHQELYIVTGDGEALVWGYAADAWYYYDSFPARCFCAYRGDLYIGTDNGTIRRVSTAYEYDSADLTTLNEIDCYWESGAMSFGADYQRKYSAMLWVAVKPEPHAEVDVTVLTDRSSGYPTKSVEYQLFDFEHVDFSDFSFETNDKPQMRRLKIKAKKFVYYKLIFKSCTNNSSVTVTGAAIRVRHTGYAK